MPNQEDRRIDDVLSAIGASTPVDTPKLERLAHSVTGDWDPNRPRKQRPYDRDHVPMIREQVNPLRVKGPPGTENWYARVPQTNLGWHPGGVHPVFHSAEEAERFAQAQWKARWKTDLSADAVINVQRQRVFTVDFRNPAELTAFREWSATHPSALDVVVSYKSVPEDTVKAMFPDSAPVKSRDALYEVSSENDEDLRAEAKRTVWLDERSHYRESSAPEGPSGFSIENLSKLPIPHTSFLRAAGEICRRSVELAAEAPECKFRCRALQGAVMEAVSQLHADMAEAAGPVLPNANEFQRTLGVVGAIARRLGTRSEPHQGLARHLRAEVTAWTRDSIVYRSKELGLYEFGLSPHVVEEAVYGSPWSAVQRNLPFEVGGMPAGRTIPIATPRGATKPVSEPLEAAPRWEWHIAPLGGKSAVIFAVDRFDIEPEPVLAQVGEKAGELLPIRTHGALAYLDASKPAVGHGPGLPRTSSLGPIPVIIRSGTSFLERVKEAQERFPGVALTPADLSLSVAKRLVKDHAVRFEPSSARDVLWHVAPIPARNGVAIAWAHIPYVTEQGVVGVRSKLLPSSDASRAFIHFPARTAKEATVSAVEALSRHGMAAEPTRTIPKELLVQVLGEETLRTELSVDKTRQLRPPEPFEVFHRLTKTGQDRALKAVPESVRPVVQAAAVGFSPVEIAQARYGPRADMTIVRALQQQYRAAERSLQDFFAQHPDKSLPKVKAMAPKLQV